MKMTPGDVTINSINIQQTTHSLLRSIIPSILMLLIGTAALFPSQAIAQNREYVLETFGTRNGLLSPKIYTLTQTTDHRLWIGSELGVSIFDGYAFKNIQYSSSNTAIGRILAIAEDSSGAVWLGGDKGLFVYMNDSIIQIQFYKRPPLAIETLLTDKRGNLWVGELNFLHKLMTSQIDSVHRHNYRNIRTMPFAGLKERAYSLATDPGGNIYMGSHGGVFVFPEGKENFSIYWNNPDPYNYVNGVAALNPDSIYFNTHDGNTSRLIKRKFFSYSQPDMAGRFLFTHNKNSYTVTTREISHVGSVLTPIVSFEGITNHAHVALIDVEENIWIGTWEGLQKFRRTAFARYDHASKEHEEVFSLLETLDGELLFGSNRGLVLKSENDSIKPHSTLPPLFERAEVLTMQQSADGAIWAGSGYQGISRFDGKVLQSFAENSSPFLLDNNCEALYPLANGKFFACTEVGVTLIDPLSSSPMSAHYNFKKSYSRYPELFGCYETSPGQYWFYGSQGLYQLRDTFLFEDSIIGMPVKSLYINRIIADRKGNTWIATQGMGLLKCRFENGRFRLVKKFDKTIGLPSDNSLSVLADKNDDIWLGDYMSISRISERSSRDEIVTFNEQDGLLSTYYQTLKLEQTRNGTVWGLTTMGVFSFHPDSINNNRLAPILRFESVTASGTEPAANILNPTKRDLSYDQNSIRFEYTAISLSDPFKIKYAYRLKEADSNWTFTNERTLNFSSLAPGTYTFQLKASNNSNVWTDAPLEYSFTIQPPFWKSVWFRLVGAAAIASGVLLLFKRRIRLVRDKAAIRQQMTELEGKALRAQMNPHFIFNSLNAIQKLIVVEDMEASYNYLSKFSKLLRLVLDNSDKNLISLSQELEMNKLYLELESLRFKKSFSYTIDLNQQTDPEIILIPSLLLQPFIENAIWHGLMHKEDDKKLLIHFSEKDGHLITIIEDNGIGRERSALIKAQKLGAQYFNSKGTQLSEQRIKLLNTNDGRIAKVEFVDLKNHEQNSCGTRVIIQIPLQKSRMYDKDIAGR
ncbi:MAG: histidine kinase [Chitinophagaceae bacterium]|nr:histidine kinase [Chitinophagaceae bacterium]